MKQRDQVSADKQHGARGSQRKCVRIHSRKKLGKMTRAEADSRQNTNKPSARLFAVYQCVQSEFGANNLALLKPMVLPVKECLAYNSRVPIRQGKVALSRTQRLSAGAWFVFLDCAPIDGVSAPCEPRCRGLRKELDRKYFLSQQQWGAHFFSLYW